MQVVYCGVFRFFGVLGSALPLSIYLLRSNGRLLILYLRMTRRILLIRVSTRNVIRLRHTLNNTRRNIINLRSFLRSLLTHVLMELRIRLITSLLTETCRSTQCRLELFTSGLNVIP